MAVNRFLSLGTVLAVLATPAFAPIEPAVDTAAIAESVQYLVSTYGVDEAEAVRRLRLQAVAADLAEDVRKVVGDELLDVWLDQTGGGKVTFLTSKPKEAQNALGKRFDNASVQLIRSQHTAAQLRAAEAEVKAKLPVGTVVGVDLRNEKIIVLQSRAALAAGASLDSVRAKVGANVGTVAVEVKAEPSPEIDESMQKTCGMACDTPMRGGVRLHVRRDAGDWGSCTAGFNVTDSSGWLYVLTAGHCVTSPGPKRQHLFHNGLPAVWEMNSSGSGEDPNSPADLRYANNSPPGLDYAVLPYQSGGGLNWGNYWLNGRPQKDLVESVCVSSGCTSGTYSLTGMYTREQMQNGWVVCATGTGTATIYPDTNTGYTPGTRCGEIKCKTMAGYDSATCNDAPGSNLYGIMVNICSRKGDSGGPLFSQIDSKAYGILSGGPAGSGACAAGEYGVYTPLSQIFDRFNAQTGRGLRLIY